MNFKMTIFRSCVLLNQIKIVFSSCVLQVQPKPGVMTGGMTLGKGGMQIQVLGASLTQMPAPLPPAPVQTQVKFHCMSVRFQLVAFTIQPKGFLCLHYRQQ